MILERLPSIITAATFSAVSIIVAHEWAYFGVVGPEFQSLYTTHDYLGELIIWIGPVFVFFIVAAAIYAASLRSDDFIIKHIATSKWGRRIEDWAQEIFYFVLMIAAFLFFDSTRRWYFYMFLGLLVTRAVGYVLSHSMFREFRKSAGAVILIVLPALMVVIYGLGQEEAYRDLKDEKDHSELLL